MKWFNWLVLALILNGCSNAEQAQWQSIGKPHVVTLYSGGNIVGRWETVGAVESVYQSDGFYFKDAKTLGPVIVSGTIVINLK